MDAASGSSTTSPGNTSHVDPDSFLEDKFWLAFGAPLVNDDSGPESGERSLWWEVVRLRGKQYSLPHGRCGTRFLNMLANEIEACTRGRQTSEREFLFTALIDILQRDKIVTKSRDIRPLLSRRMDMWDAGRLRELLQEAKRCNRQLGVSNGFRCRANML